MSTGSVIRKRLAVTVTLALLAAVIATFLTGFVAAALDLNRFGYHKYAAYLAIALAVAHVVFHWRSLTGQFRRWLLRAAPPTSPAAGGRRTSESPPVGLTRRALLWPGFSLAAGVSLGHLAASHSSTPPVLEEGEDLGQVYHQWSKPSYAGTLLKALSPRPQPDLYKEYAGAITVPLAPPPPPGGLSLEEVIARRRSIREYADRAVGLDELARLLHYSAGVTDRRDPSWWFRSVPSSGALFPIEVYVVAFNIAGLAPGVYHYAVRSHQLELVRGGDFRQQVFEAAVFQEMVLRTALVIVLTGLFARVQWKYADRSYRYLLLEAGHLGQNVYLVATALGLGPCGIGAYFDDDLNRLIGVDGRDEATLYLLSVGAARAA